MSSGKHKRLSSLIYVTWLLRKYQTLDAMRNKTSFLNHSVGWNWFKFNSSNRCFLTIFVKIKRQRVCKNIEQSHNSSTNLASGQNTRGSFFSVERNWHRKNNSLFAVIRLWAWVLRIWKKRLWSRKKLFLFWIMKLFLNIMYKSKWPFQVLSRNFFWFCRKRFA